MHDRLRWTNRRITVASTSADAGDGSGRSHHQPPTMAPTPVAATRYARPSLALVPRDAIVAAVEAFDAKLAEPAAMVEYPPAVPEGKVLFRYGRANAEELAAMAIPVALLTPHVRALWWELAEAVETEARKRV